MCLVINKSCVLVLLFSERRLKQHMLMSSTTHLISTGNCAFVTRKLEILHSWSSFKNLLISGYMMGSPTRDNAQCFTVIPSVKRCSLTPGTPAQHSEKEQAQQGTDRGESLLHFFIKIFYIFLNGALI